MRNQINVFNFRHSLLSVVISNSCICLLFFLGACARQGAPAGGPKDTKPPAIDTLASTPNFSTQFDRKRIELKFDEWVVLTDANTQVMVSPPLAKRPEVALKGKSVVVTFDKNEVLRPNTTYTINFGSAVKDLHEGNTAQDLRFVFSTGDFIDSLSVKGMLTDAFTGDPVENIAIMLYENLSDTALRKERPYYFTRTDKSGNYEFRNLKPGDFRIVAIEDNDQNLKWDGENERLGFLDSTLRISDSLRGLIKLKLFKNQSKFRLLGQNANRYGLVKVGFSTPLQSYDIQTIAPGNLKTLPEKTQDSLLYWYDLPSVDTGWTLILSSTETLTQDSGFQAPKSRHDTIEIKKLLRSEFLKNHRISFGDLAAPITSSTRGKSQTLSPRPPAVKTVVQSPGNSMMLPFNVPIVGFDTARWRILVDSTRVTNFQVKPDSESPRKLIVTGDWKQGKSYTLWLLPGGLTDFWGGSNTDSLSRIFNVLPEKQLGALTLTLGKLRPGAKYVLQLMNGNILEAERAFNAATDSEKMVFVHLQVATYTARLLEDLNGNGRWDSGDFKTKRQPEPVFTKKLEPLRANWDLEAVFNTEEGVEQKRKK